jgi:autotransporter-associated beta strand protein
MSTLSSATRLVAFLLLVLLSCLPLRAQRQSENLGRGVVAMRPSSTEAYISWRLLGSDPADVAFNLYRSIGGGVATKVNATPIAATTDYRDTLAVADFTSAISYYVCPVVGGVEQAASASYTLPANTVAGRQFVSIPLSTPRPNPASTYNYDVKFCWVGDLDGDGEYDYVVDRISTFPVPDRGVGAYIGERQYLEAYKRDGTFLWRMDMGPNSINQYVYEPGSSAISIGDSDNVTVFDLDGDGRAEVVVRTANGVTVADAGGTQVASIATASDTDQFVSVFDGQTGAERARLALPNPWSQHGTLTNKCAIAFLDGVRPSVVVYGYNRADSSEFYRSFSAFDFRDGALTLRWNWAQNQAVQPGAEGHQIRIADVDNDGCDEICDIGHVVDHDGTQLFYTDLSHGDRVHVADIDPDHPGLETYIIQQYSPKLIASALYGSGTGEMLVRRYMSSSGDVGRGIAIDIDPNHFGLEMYCTQPGVFDAKGNRIFANTIWPPEGLWWDGDLSREFVDGAGTGAYNPVINKFNPATGVVDRMVTLYNDDTGTYTIRQAYGGRPAFLGDLFGDWREEMIFVTSDFTALRIYTTTTSATNRLYTLMQNPAYRGQTTTKGYWESPYTDYYLGTGMTPPPPAPVTSARLVWQGGAGAANIWDTATAAWREGVLGTAAATYTEGDAVLFDLTGHASAPVALSGTLAPGAVTVYSPTSYTFDGTAGTLSGGMTLAKVGAGALTLTGSHNFTGTTTIWDGALVVDGALTASPVVVYGGTWGGPLAKGTTGGRLAGSGHIVQPVTLNYRASLTPGAGMGSAGTLYLEGGLTTAAGSTLAFDLSDDPTGLGKANDKLVVTGDLAIGGATTLHFNLLNGTLAAGTYTVATVSGTLSGTADLSVTGLDGVPYTLSVAGGAIAIVVPATRAADSISWQGGAGAQWDNDTTAAWLRGGVSDVFVSGDAVAFDAIGASASAVTIAQPVKPAAITVSGDTSYTFTGSGRIVGSSGLTKSGSGKLTIATSNTFTGPVAINGGTVSIATMSDSGMAGPLGSAAATSGGLTLSGGTLEFTGAEATSTDRIVTLGAGGGTIIATTANVGFQLAGGVEGPGQLVKDGAGILSFSTGNTYSGGTVLNAGTLILSSVSANVSGLGTGLVTLNGGTLTMSNNIRVYGTVAPMSLAVPAGATARLDVDGRASLTGALTGAGTLNLYTPYFRTNLNGDWSAFAGRINAFTGIEGGDFRIGNSAGLPAAELDLAALVSAYYIVDASDTVPIGALSSSATTSSLKGVWLENSNPPPTTSAVVTWRIGGLNRDTTFAGAIADSVGGAALEKVGTGTFTLTGVNTYTGATTVSGGTLLINGSSSASPITVRAGGTLGGSGAIAGPVNFEAGSAVLLGNVPVAVTGNVTLAGTVSVAFGSSLTDGTYTVLTATGISGVATLAYSGPLSAGQVATVENTGTAITLKLVNESGMRSPATTTWTGAVSADWSTTANNWKLNTDGSATAFIAGDAVNFDDTLLGNADIAVVTAASPASVTFANATTAYTITSAGGGISGTGTLTKGGAGLVTLEGDNSYTGVTTINAGTLLLHGANASSAITVNSGGSLGGAGTVAGPVTFVSGASLAATAAGTLAVNNTVTLPATMTVSAPANVADGTYTILTATALSGTATWSYTGPLYIGQSAVVTTSGNSVLATFSGTVSTRQPGATKWSGAISGAWNTSTVFNWTATADGTATAFTSGDSVTFDDTLAGNAAITVASAVVPKAVTFANTATAYGITSTSPGISGVTTLVKDGAGTTTLTGTNTYTGGTVINAGVLALGDKASNGTALGTGPITLNGGTLKYFFTNAANTYPAIANNLVVPAGASARIQFDQRCTVTSALTGAGTLTIWIPYVRTELKGNWSAFTGQLNVTADLAANNDVVQGEGGEFRIQTSTGFASASVALANGVNTYYLSPPASGVNIAFGALSGASGARITGTTTAGRTATWTIGALGRDTTFAGIISSGTGPSAVTKVGTGTLTFSGANTYTGATTVNAGVLVISGTQSNGAGATTVNGGTLRITGSLTNTSTVEVKSGATLELTGTLTTGTLTIRSGGKLIGGGTIIGNVVNEGLISATGSASFVVTGNVTNAASGVIRLVRGAGLSCSGTFANNGVVDYITAGTHPAAGDTGTTLTAASLAIVDFAYVADAGSVLTLATGYEGHTYQLQRTTDLADSGSWALLGTAVDGTGAAMVFTDDNPPAGVERCFYRVIVDP